MNGHIAHWGLKSTGGLRYAMAPSGVHFVLTSVWKNINGKEEKNKIVK